MANGNATQAMQFFMDKGYTPEQAAGIVGNLMQESRLNPRARNPGDGRDGSDSIGLAQWNGPRAQQLRQFAKNQKTSPFDFNTQLEFIDHELRTTESNAGNLLSQAQTVDDATAAFVAFERPQGFTANNPQGAHGFGNRLKFAQNVSGRGGSGPRPIVPDNMARNTATGAKPSGGEGLSKLASLFGGGDGAGAGSSLENIAAFSSLFNEPEPEPVRFFEPQQTPAPQFQQVPSPLNNFLA